MRVPLLGAMLVAVGALSAHAEEVVLDTGEVLRGTLVERTDANVVVDHPVLGRLTIAADRVREVRPDSPPVVVEEVPVPPAAPAPEAPPPEEKPKSPWKKTGLVGYSGTQGNTTAFDLRVGLGAEMEDEERRVKLATGYLLSETEGDRDDNNFFFSALHDWVIQDSKWFPFAVGRYDWDEFEQWDGRVSLGGGVGYQWIDDPDLKVRLRAGATGTREFGSDDDSWRPELLLGGEFKKTLNDTQTLEGSLFYVPDLDETGEYRTLAKLEWSIKLDNDDSVHLKLGVENEYDSHREDPFKSHDFKYFVALSFEF